MCGIAGVLMTADRGLDAEVAVRRMTDRMAARGPDAEGFWRDAEAGIHLGHRRLSIIDPVARSDQPMLAAGGRRVIVFNGEIYNFAELRQGLEAAGARFATRGDTEVILQLYEREGVAAFGRLRGMFAVAIWDRDRRELVLARDAYGIKPLYVARVAGAVLFASQVKAVMASGLVPPRPSAAGLAGFYLWGSVPEPFSLYRAVLSVAAGGWVRLGADGGETHGEHGRIADAWAAPPGRLGRGGLQNLVREAVADTVRAHTVSDVPVAAFLSGGVDSGAVAAHAAEQGHRLECVTVAFPEFDGRPQNETLQAAETAGRYGLRHTVRRVGADEFRADLPALLEAMDQPSIDGVNTWFAAKAVAELGYKVALSGIGGDELFRGYSTFRRAPTLALAARCLGALGPLRAWTGLAFDALSAATGQPKIKAIGTLRGGLAEAYRLQRGLYLPSDLPHLIGPLAAREALETLEEGAAGAALDAGLDPMQAVGVLESSGYLRHQLLRDSDWASMAHSIELRAPLVDLALARRLAPHGAAFEGGAGKRLLGRSPRPGLPEALIERRKTGFGIPLADWISARDGPPPAPPGVDLGRGWARGWALRVAAAFTGENPLHEAA